MSAVIDHGPKRMRRRWSVGILLAAACGVAPAWADPEIRMTAPGIPDPSGPPAPADAPVRMVLEAFVNGAPTHQLLVLRRLPNGEFMARADELQAIRIRTDGLETGETEILLSRLGVIAQYDEARQTIALTAPVERLEPHRIDIGGDRQPTDISDLRPLNGVILNYGLYAQGGSEQASLSGDVEVVGLSGVGAVSNSALFRSGGAFGDDALVRLDSRWRRIDPLAVRSYLAGDFASNALAWTGSVRLAGFQIASAFEQRTDIVTTALPQFSGAAALPSTLDLYVGQQRIFSGETPSGPFTLQGLPFVAGDDIRLILTDAAGRQIETSRSYYYLGRQLKAGLLQYSVDVGAPRLNYGRTSFDYDDTVFAAASGRYGVSDRLTVEARTEGAADGLIGGGIGVVQSLGGHGAVLGSLSASRYRQASGGKYTLEAQGRWRGLQLFATTERTFGDYYDLVRVSLHRDADRRRSTAVNWGDTTEAAHIVDRAGVTYAPGFDRSVVNLSYARIATTGLDQRTVNLSLARPIGDRSSLYVSGYADLDGRDRYGVFATISLRFGGGVSASTSLVGDARRTGVESQIGRSSGQRRGDLGWNLSARRYDDGGEQHTASVSYRTAQAAWRAQLDQGTAGWRFGVQAEGAVVAAGGGVFAANRVGEAFAVVRNAGPGVEVMQGGVRMGRTDADGRALLPALIPYYGHRIAIDPIDLPEGWEAEATERTVVAGWRQGGVVDFGARKVQSAVIVIQRPDGSLLPPGLAVRRNGRDAGVSGYDGQVYLRDLEAHNTVAVDLGSAGICHAVFDHDLAGPVQPTIGPVLCR